MSSQGEPAAENQLAPSEQLVRQSPAQPGPIPPHASAGDEITVGKRKITLQSREVEIFTMTLGSETIELLPLKNWGQLDVFKWRVRGKLPGTPAGLEITFDHIKLFGQTVYLTDSDGRARLEKLFVEWLTMERETAELARKKLKPGAHDPGSQEPSAEPQAMRYKVELDKEGIVHIHCVQGKEVLGTIGLNVPGFQSFVNQGWMRKPHALKTGALHDWVELDGIFFSFEHGNNDAAKLEEALNASYLPASNRSQGNEIVVFANAASSTGFDIQFPAKAGGVLDKRRRPLGEDSLELIQDPERCGLLKQGLVIKLSRPNLIFKQKTPDGGERYFDHSPENIVRVVDEDGEEKLIDLSQPVNYLHLTPLELTAVFNHPGINRHAQAGPKKASTTSPPKTEGQPHGTAAGVPAAAPATKPVHTEPAVTQPPVQVAQFPAAPAPQIPTKATAPAEAPPASRSPSAPRPIATAPVPVALPNLWLKPLLELQPIRYDWFAFLVYAKAAAWYSNSSEGTLMGYPCWFIRTSESDDLSTPAFKGLFMTDKGAFGVSSGARVARCENNALTIGALGATLQAEGIRLLGVAVDSAGCPVLIVNDDYRSKFSAPPASVAAEIASLKSAGAVLLSAQEALQSTDAIQVVWTAPAEQSNPADPQALERIKPESAAAPIVPAKMGLTGSQATATFGP